MMPDDAYLSRLQATIASLRYWVPAVKDTARVAESDADGAWRLAVHPKFKAACPFELILARDGSYGLKVDGVTHDNLAVDDFELFLPLVEAISAGHVRRRLTFSANTGIETEVETVIDLADGRQWAAKRTMPLVGIAANAEASVCRDIYFLPYRRD
jgi:hypothetical protein